nr:hypothetical protein [Tanacetum cinerariifolium]
MISLGQKNILTEYMILSGADNRPPMLDKDLFDSWKSRMELYMQNREHKIMILESVEHGPLIWPTIEENRGDDLIAYVNRAMAFLTAIVSLRRNNASEHARVVNCYNCQGEGHMARQCTQPKRTRNTAWYKEKSMLAEAREARQILDEEQLAFIANLGVPDGQAVQIIIPNNVAFQTEDLDTYDSDCDDISNAQAVLMANISNYGPDVVSEVSHFKTYLNDMENQRVHAMHDYEQTPAVDYLDNEIHSDSILFCTLNILKKHNR